MRTVDQDPDPNSFEKIKSCGFDMLGRFEGGVGVAGVGALGAGTSGSSSRKSTRAHAGGLLRAPSPVVAGVSLAEVVVADMEESERDCDGGNIRSVLSPGAGLRALFVTSLMFPAIPCRLARKYEVDGGAEHKMGEDQLEERRLRGRGGGDARCPVALVRRAHRRLLSSTSAATTRL